MNADDKRNFRRYLKSENFALKFNKKLLNAKTVDYSLDGVGVVVRDGEVAHMRKGDVVGFRIAELETETFGEIMWIHKGDSTARLGIKYVGLLKGRLGNFRLSDTLLGLQRGQKTGTLVIETGTVVKKVYVRNGDMIFSSSNQDEDRLGDLLLRQGIISREQYDHSVEELKKTGQRQGAILVRLGYLDPAGLVAAVRYQVEEIVRGLFELEDGSISFQEMPLPTEELITMKLSVANLIYHGIKKTDKPHLFQGETLSAESRVRFSPDPLDLFQDLKLDFTGRKIVSFIDGVTSVRQIMSLTGLEEYEVISTIAALLNIRMVEMSEVSGQSKDIPSEVVEEIIEQTVETAEQRDIAPDLKAMIEDMHRRYEGLGYYGVLGVKEQAPVTAIKNAYYQAAKKFHPDIHFSLADDSLKAKLSDIFSYVYDAYSVLTNPEKRKEYDRVMTIRPARLNATQDKARASFAEGKAEFRLQKYAEAALRFGQAAYYDNTIAEYHYYYGLTLAAQNRFKDAERALERARRLEPHNASYLAELGFVHLSLGFRTRARGFFEKALTIQPENARAAEGMAIVKTD